MECFTVNEMASFLDGMAGKDRGKFIKHLNQCPECFNEYCFLAEIMAENVGHFEAVHLVNINHVNIYPLGYKYLLVLFTHTLGFPGPVFWFCCLCSFTGQ